MLLLLYSSEISYCMLLYNHIHKFEIRTCLYFRKNILISSFLCEYVLNCNILLCQICIFSIITHNHNNMLSYYQCRQIFLARFTAHARVASFFSR